jgi:hypothetical protein
MPWTAPIDAYCERASTAFWAEPVNAATNAAFILAGLWALVLWRRTAGRDGARDWPSLALIGVTLCVGAGSFLFHTFANRWSLLADVIPIAVFIHGYVALSLGRYAGWPWWLALAGTLFFFGFNAGFPGFVEALLGPGTAVASRGSLGYVPALLALVGVGGALAASRRPQASRRAGRTLLAAAGVFAASLAFRTLDQPVCEAWPLGTHFLWHGLNAVVLFLLLRAAIRHGPAPRA